jgi:RNA polymerase sigma-70 factor (ECF subfamily)
MTRGGIELRVLSVRAASGDEVAFRALIEAMTPTLHRLALRLLKNPADAADAFQDACVRAWRKLPTLKEHDAVAGWLCRIMQRTAIERLRSRARQKTEPLQEQSGTADQFGPEKALASAQFNRELCRTVAHLKEKHRVVLLLRDVDGMSYREIADALGCAVGTVESRLHRARAALAKKMERAERVSGA